MNSTGAMKANELTLDNLQVKLHHLELIRQSFTVERREPSRADAGWEATIPAYCTLFASECRESTIAIAYSIDEARQSEETCVDLELWDDSPEPEHLHRNGPLERREMPDNDSGHSIVPKRVENSAIDYLRESNRKFTRSINEIMREVRSL